MIAFLIFVDEYIYIILSTPPTMFVMFVMDQLTMLLILRGQGWATCASKRVVSFYFDRRNQCYGPGLFEGNQGRIARRPRGAFKTGRGGESNPHNPHACMQMLYSGVRSNLKTWQAYKVYKHTCRTSFPVGAFCHARSSPREVARGRAES